MLKKNEARSEGRGGHASNCCSIQAGQGSFLKRQHFNMDLKREGQRDGLGGQGRAMKRSCKPCIGHCDNIYFECSGCLIHNNMLLYNRALLKVTSCFLFLFF